MNFDQISVCADDFGMDPAINAAALKLADAGRLSAISCMVGATRWAEQGAALRALDPGRVEVGLHLDLTEFPIRPGVRRALRQWIIRTHLDSRTPRGLREEVEAQLDEFERVFGSAPAFVDGHEHVHEFPHVRQLLVEALEARRWTPWLRSTRRPPGLRSFKAWMIDALGAEALADLAARHGLRQNRHFLGVYGFDGQTYLEHLREWLAAIQPGDLLVCHPAEGWPSAAPSPAARAREFELLAGPEFADLLAARGLRIGPLEGSAGSQTSKREAHAAP